MQIPAERFKVKIRDVESKPEMTRNHLTSGHYLLGIAAYGQIGDDREQGLYTAFVIKDYMVTSVVQVTITDDEDYMALVFEEIVEKFNKLNSHLTFVKAKVENTSRIHIKNILLNYVDVIRNEHYKRVNSFFR